MSEDREQEESITSGANCEADPADTIAPSRLNRQKKKRTGATKTRADRREKGKTNRHPDRTVNKLTRKQLSTILLNECKGVPRTISAEHFGLTHRAVNDVIEYFKPIFQEIEQVPRYRQVKSELLDAAELKMLKSLLSEDKIEKASLNNVAYAFQQVFQAGRLQRGQSTANIDQKTQFTSVQIDSSDLSD